MDLISRQDAIDALQERYKLHDWDDDGEAKAECGAIIREIYALPSAQKMGFWYALEKGDKGYSAGDFKCSVCGEPNHTWLPKPNFCPNCGADMRGGTK